MNVKYSRNFHLSLATVCPITTVCENSSVSGCQKPVQFPTASLPNSPSPWLILYACFLYVQKENHCVNDQKLKEVIHIGSVNTMGQIWAILTAYQSLNNTLPSHFGKCWLCVPPKSNSDHHLVSPTGLLNSLTSPLINC